MMYSFRHTHPEKRWPDTRFATHACNQQPQNGSDHGADKGVSYAADESLSDDDFLKAIFLELKTDNVDAMRQQIVAFGVTVLDVPDPHLYFQAPGGQVWRLVGIGEDLSRYEGTEDR